MTLEPLVFLAGGAGAVLMLYSVSSILFARNKEGRGGEGGKRERRTLEEISGLWTGRGQVVHFKDIARLWREVPVAAKGESRPRPTFHHPELAAFFAEWVEGAPAVKAMKRTVIEKVLAILDTQGDCPSVVNKTPQESEAKLDKDVFARLGTIPLWQHALAVTREMARKVKQEVMLPDALIAGLGHDLGKIPAFLDTLYRTGDHPLISLIVLHRIPEFETMPNREEVSEAIRQHHQVKPDSSLGAALKEADRQVRLEEISRLTRPDVVAPASPAKKKRETPGSAAAAPAAASPAASNQTAITPPEPDVAPAGETLEEHRAGELATGSGEAQPSKTSPGPGGASEPHPGPPAASEPALPLRPAAGEGGIELAWMDPEAILAGVRTRINTLSAAGRWSVVSSAEGLVFAQQEALWEVVKKVAGADPQVLAADGDETGKRAILLTVVRELARQKKAVATEFVADGFFTSQCIVVMESGRTLQVPLIPFRAQAFGVLPSELEAEKRERLKKMVKTIKPKQILGGGPCGVFD